MTSTKTENLSINDCIWLQRQVDERLVIATVQRYNIPEVIARVLIARKVDIDDIAEFLNPKLRTALPDPFHLLDMQKAADRISDAIKNNETIGIFGDYDVDGATSTALLKKFVEAVGGKAIGYIPDRIKEGYGPNIKAFETLKKQGASLIVTVDCGIVAFKEVEEITKQGVDVVIIDHHIGETKLPNAVAVVNPHRIDETTEHNYLAAVGVVFLVCIATNKVMREQGWFSDKKAPDLLQYLDLVALGTVCDVVPLIKANRAFVIQGLKIIMGRQNVGISALVDIGKINTAPTDYHLGFVLGPRINAGGRIGTSNLGFKLLSTKCSIEASQIAKSLDDLNQERKAIQEAVLEQAQEQVENNPISPVIFAKNEGWHHGVVGIAAGRLTEIYHSPVAVIAMENGIGKASMRSIDGVDIGAVITIARNLGIIIAGGGHAMAGGFTVAEDKIDELHKLFIERLEKDIEKSTAIKMLEFDGYISIAGLKPDFAKLLEKAGPYGVGNPSPRFVLHNIHIIKSSISGAGHVSCIVSDGRDSKRVMAFRSADTALGKALITMKGKKIHLIGEVRYNKWMGREEASFIINDMAFV